MSSEEYKEVNKGILDVTSRTLEISRKIAHDLLPPILEKFGLKSAIEELADDYNSSKKIHIEYVLNYPKDLINKTSELHIFRIIQELINNSIKHGNAKNINLVIENQKPTLSIKYSDNGVGFDVTRAQYQKGLGMKNIESRIELLNATLEIKSEINKGTTFTINI